MREEMTFDNYIVNTSNSMALNIAGRIAEKKGCPQLSYIYGDSGNGKTHLMKAILTAVCDDKTYESAEYITAEDITAEILNAIRKTNTEQIIQKYSDIGLLLIDNFDVFINKDATSYEIYRIFEKRIAEGRPSVVASVKKLVDSPYIPQLAGVLQESVQVGIEAMDIKQRMQVLGWLSKDYRKPLFSQETCEKIAENMDNSRMMKSFLKKVDIYLDTFSKDELTEGDIDRLIEKPEEKV